jgi:O-antigen/teichoic acid export membrane protein
MGLGARAAGDAAVPRRVWGATLLLFLGRQWGALCTFFALVLLARGLSGDQFGRLTFYLAFFALLDVLVDCGTSTVVVQRGAADETIFAAHLAAGRRIRLASSALAAVLVLAAGLALDRAQAGWIALAALSAFARVAELSSVVFQRAIEWRVPVLLRALGASLRLGAVALLARCGADSFGPYLAVHAGGLALGNLALHFAARRRLPAPAPRAGLAGVFAAALPLAAAGLCQQAYFYVDNLFVRAIEGPEALGRYNAAVKLFAWLVFFAAFATTSALPWLARRSLAGELASAVARLAQPLLLLACAGLGALWPWTSELLALVYGPGFTGAGTSLRWLLGAALAVYLGAPCLTAVIAAGRARAALGIAALALVVNVGANALLVPARGIEGAAMTTFLTESAVLGLSGLVLLRLGALPRERPWLWLLAAPLFAGASFLSRALCVPIFAP